MTMALSPQTLALVERLRARWAPPEAVGVLEWAERERWMAPGTSAMPGPYRVSVTPYLRGILAACTAPAVWKVVCQKSAQVAWTDGVVNNYLGWTIAVHPRVVLMVYPKEASAKAYTHEKLEPMIDATPALRARVDLTSRKAGNTALLKTFAGGFLKLVGANSPANMKSTPAPIVIVEEPDDISTDVRGQGDAIKLAEERTKTFHPDRLVLIGGTPSVAGLSSIEQEMRASDQRRYHVPCHECGHCAPLAWEHVSWPQDPARNHPIYGHAVTEATAYVCPGCGATWNDVQRVANIARAEEAPGGGWQASAAFNGIAGFYLSELYSPFPASRLQVLVQRYLEAEAESRGGEHGALITFVNSALGLPWQLSSDAPAEERLRERAEQDYGPGVNGAAWTVPHGAVALTAGVDVQHDRLHLGVWAWGRGEESWLVWRGAIPGTPVDWRDEVWQALDEHLARAVQRADGASLHMRAVSVDSSDGQTSDAVYHYVRNRRLRAMRIRAVKGSSTREREIFSKPRESVDTTRTDKASRYGLRPYIVGVHKAKELLAARLKLDRPARGPGRMHWYAGVEDDWYAQMTSEVLWPGRGGKPEWRLKAGFRNEDLDCAVYALHAARSLRLHVWTEQRWRAEEQRLVQHDLVAAADQAPVPAAETAERVPAPVPARPAPPAARPVARRAPRSGGFVGSW